MRGADVPEGVPLSEVSCSGHQGPSLRAFQGGHLGTTGPTKALSPRVLAFLLACIASPRWRFSRGPPWVENAGADPDYFWVFCNFQSAGMEVNSRRRTLCGQGPGQ